MFLSWPQDTAIPLNAGRGLWEGQEEVSPMPTQMLMPHKGWAASIRSPLFLSESIILHPREPSVPKDHWPKYQVSPYFSRYTACLRKGCWTDFSREDITKCPLPQDTAITTDQSPPMSNLFIVSLTGHGSPPNGHTLESLTSA